MPKIKNWTKKIDRTVEEVEGSIVSTIKKWEHDNHNQEIRILRHNENKLFYLIEFGDEGESSRSSLEEAVDLAVWAMRENPEGYGDKYDSDLSQ